jgi:cytochrome c6
MAHFGSRRSALQLAALLGLITLTAVGLPQAAFGADIEKGRRIYNMHCAGCHGATGISMMPSTPNFARNEGLLQPDMMLLTTMRNGKNAMPGYVGILNDREMLDVIAYLRTLFR